MLSDNIQRGDVLLGSDGEVIYMVTGVTVDRPHVLVQVRFSDGGEGTRMFEIGKGTEIVRPD